MPGATKKVIEQNQEHVHKFCDTIRDLTKLRSSVTFSFEEEDLFSKTPEAACHDASEGLAATIEGHVKSSECLANVKCKDLRKKLETDSTPLFNRLLFYTAHLIYTSTATDIKKSTPHTIYEQLIISPLWAAKVNIEDHTKSFTSIIRSAVMDEREI